MEKTLIIKEVIRLIAVKRVQEIAIWKCDTDVLLLDGTCNNYEWGCEIDQMSELGDELKSLLEGAGYEARFSGGNVSNECVRIILAQDSEIHKNFAESCHEYVEGSELGRRRINIVTYVKNPPCGHSRSAIVGHQYFLR